jgi:hypothetical protein
MKYYLYKQGTLTGPVASDKIEELKISKKLFEYQWMIDDESQTWKSICETPKENPFQISQKNMKDRTLSGAFFIAKNAYSGEIRTIHSFGVEIVLQHQKSILRGLSEFKSIFLNLCDETNFTFVNAKAIVQSQELTEDGLHIRFSWDQQGVAL